MEKEEKKIIMVFGSNLAGIHGAGAALHARRYCGAEDGIGEGPTGEAYALPTKDAKIRSRLLVDIDLSVQIFKTYAKFQETQHQDILFKVTRVGCGLAGFTNEQIAPMFKQSPSNCGFPPEWESFGLPTWAEKGIT